MIIKNAEVILKSQQRFISNKHDVYTEDVNKIALSNDDDKRIVSSNKITSYSYGYKYINENTKEIGGST